jgi:hypothetical protein
MRARGAPTTAPAVLTPAPTTLAVVLAVALRTELTALIGAFTAPQLLSISMTKRRAESLRRQYKCIAFDLRRSDSVDRELLDSFSRAIQSFCVTEISFVSGALQYGFYLAGQFRGRDFKIDFGKPLRIQGTLRISVIAIHPVSP